MTFIAGEGSTAASVPAEVKARLKQCVAYRIDHPDDADDVFLDRLFESLHSGCY